MKKISTNSNTGFSLIETILYLALYGIIIGGLVISVFNIFESHNRNKSKAMLVEEGLYLLNKIDWALSGAQSVNTATDHQISIRTLNLPENQNPLKLDFDSGNMRLTRGLSNPKILNNSNTSVENLTFTHTVLSGVGIAPESITASFTLSTKTVEGFNLSQFFTTTKYLRK